MKIGLDTGFFIDILFKKEKAISIWEDLIKKDYSVYVSSLVIYELTKRLLKVQKFKKVSKYFYEAIKDNCYIIKIDEEIAIQAAHLSYSTGVHMADCLIYTCYKSVDCNIIFTKDRHFLELKDKKMKIEIL